MKILVSQVRAGTRLDLFLRKNQEEYSRAFFNKLIKKDLVLLNGTPARASTVLKADDCVSYTLPKPEECSLQGEDIPLDIIYEDKGFIVVNKPYGLVVHPGAGHKSGTLVHALLNRQEKLSGIGGLERPGIVHRLDKDTSGVIVVAKTDRVHASLSKQFTNRTIKKEYLCLVAGRFQKKEGRLESVIGRHPGNRKKMSSKTSRGREAVTLYKVEREFAKTSLVRCFPQTGRTHQIRVHMAEAGHPILGDPIYGGKYAEAAPRLCLHASSLTFTHPLTDKRLTFKSPLPEELLRILSVVKLSS